MELLTLVQSSALLLAIHKKRVLCSDTGDQTLSAYTYTLLSIASHVCSTDSQCCIVAFQDVKVTKQLIDEAATLVKCRTGTDELVSIILIMMTILN
jgi:hypothetical protein